MTPLFRLAAIAAIVIGAATGSFAQPAARAQGTIAAKPRFEVASIKRCTRGIGEGRSPNIMRTPCVTLAQIIYQAYVTFAEGRFNGLAYPMPMEGLPAWTDSDSGRYQIEAKAEGTPGQYMMHGPMLQALLEDRFALRIHREAREGLVYSLTVAKGGIRMQVFQGGCNPVDSEKPLESFHEGDCRPSEQRNGSNVTTDDVTNMDAFAYYLARATGLGAQVINKTGLRGYFHVHMQYESRLRPGDRGYQPPSDDPPFESIFTAVEKQLGLKLQAGKGARQFLVVDHVERPSEN